MEYRNEESWQQKFKRVLVNAGFSLHHISSERLIANNSLDRKILVVKFKDGKPDKEELKNLKAQTMRVIECVVCPDKEKGRFKFHCAKGRSLN